MPLYKYLEFFPILEEGVYVAPSADVIGQVILKKDSSVWHQSVLRADINKIIIGSQTNIQDLTMIHVADQHPCIVEDHVTIGHRVVLHGCYIESGCTIGMGAIILNGVKVGANSIVGAGSLITENTIIPEGHLVYGSPAKIIRPLSEEEINNSCYWANKYIKVKDHYIHAMDS